jgi:hypothetical protein
MGHADYLRLGGDYNAICDRCGSKFKFSQLKLEWDGLYVCTANGCFENRQPQDYVKGVRDNMAVPVSRPDQPPVYIADLIATETPTITLSFIKYISRMLTVSVSSVASIIKTLYPFTPATKVLDGAAVNQTTLG